MYYYRIIHSCPFFKQYIKMENENKNKKPTKTTKNKQTTTNKQTKN